jgi:prolyl 4-hydroxylase
MPKRFQSRIDWSFVEIEAETTAVTSDIQQWIVSQAQAGHDATSLLKAMCDSGWQEEAALETIQKTLSQFLEQRSVEMNLPAPVAVPDISLEDAANALNLGDRVVGVVMAMQVPRVVVLSGFLSDEECQALISAAAPRMQRSLTVDHQTGADQVHAQRTSHGMFFSRGENEVIQRIENRLAKLLNWPVENGEGLQVLHYQPGHEYKPHYDYFDPNEPSAATVLARGGQRVATVLMYLNEPTRGGGTTFPSVNLEISPQKGSAVFFNYDRAHPVSRTLHGGAPVREGEKWVATKWLRERKFE